MRLIVSEKPSMGRAIAVALGLPGTGRSFIQGQGLIVTWCVGHLVQAQDPEAYDPALKRWGLEPLPFLPDPFRFEPIKSSQDQWKVVKELLNRDDVTEVVNATDAGREGQLIFHLVYQLAACRKPVTRLWTSSLTEESIREAYGAMKPDQAYAGLTDAARCRMEADWLVGINCTRAQTLVAQAQGAEGVHSIGRVQTPTLALLVNRELDIQSFVPKDFWTVLATFGAGQGTYQGKWFRTVDGKEQDRLDTEPEAKALVAKLQGLSATVASVTAKQEKKRPELLYDLTALQKEANKRFGFTAEHTLAVAQDLYEAKFISYPRTNSRHLTEADAAKAPQWLKALDQGPYAEFVAELRGRWPLKLDKRFVNDKEVEDHTALTPTEKRAEHLPGDQARIYDLIARRFLAAYYPDRVEGKTAIVTRIEDETFKTNGTVVKELGWSRVDPPHARPKKEGDEDEEAATLPPLKKGQAVETLELRPKTGQTSPPKRMSEGDLLSAMQAAGRELKDEELKGAMKDCGLGTPATRANIIETLLKRGFVERKRNILAPTAKGISLIQSIQVEALKSPSLTGEWEAAMERMRRGQEPREAFMARVRAFVTDLVARIKETAPRGFQRPPKPRRPEEQVLGPCPRCGSDLLLRSFEERFYVQCEATLDASCRVSFGTDSEGHPQEGPCRFCGHPLRRTKEQRLRCSVCLRDPEDTETRPEPPHPVPCEGCGKETRPVWSAKKHRYYLRCEPCDRWQTPEEVPAPAPCQACAQPMVVRWSTKKHRWYLFCEACQAWRYPG